jgi:hypothetical protein
MKRLFFALAVIISAATVAAFTIPGSTSKKQTFYYFQYPANISATDGEVEDETRWVPADDMSGCTEGEARACKIKVSDDHVDNGVLQTSANILATEVSGVAYIAGGNLEDFSNRANP